MPENELNVEDESTEAKLTGEMLERWELLERIGEGGMSEVYRARHVIMNKLGAVKFLKADLSGDLTAVRRFQQEAMASASLAHANVVQVFDCGVSERGFYIILEFLEGTSLADILDERAEHSEDGRGRMTVAEALPIFLAVCDGLEHAHEKGIVHRDMKPSNIMIVDKYRGSEKIGTEVKLVDFGIAKIVLSAADGRDVHSLTRTGEVFGSPLYMSPEQCMGKPLDGRADMYSVGCLIYETLTGRKAISGLNPTDTMMRHVQEKPDLSGLDHIEHPQAARIKAIVTKCLEKSPENRFSDMRQLHQALSECEDHSKVKPGKKKVVKSTGGGGNDTLPIVALTGVAVLLGSSMAVAIYSLWPSQKINERTLDLKVPVPPLQWSFPQSNWPKDKQDQQISKMSTGTAITRQKDWEKDGGLKRMVQSYIDCGYMLAERKRYNKAGSFFDDALDLLDAYPAEVYDRTDNSTGNINDRVRAATGEAYCYHAQNMPGNVRGTDDGEPSESDEVEGERDLEEALTISKIKNGATHPALLQAYKVYATLLESHKNLSGAYSKLQEGVAALPPVQSEPDTLERAHYVAHLAELARITEDDKDAERHYDAAIGLLKQGQSQDHRLLADLLLRSGLNASAQENFRKAHNSFMEAYNLYLTLKVDGEERVKIDQLKKACLVEAYDALKHYDLPASIMFRLQNGI